MVFLPTQSRTVAGTLESYPWTKNDTALLAITASQLRFCILGLFWWGPKGANGNQWEEPKQTSCQSVREAADRLRGVAVCAKEVLRSCWLEGLVWFHEAWVGFFHYSVIRMSFNGYQKPPSLPEGNASNSHHSIYIKNFLNLYCFIWL